ncbi:interleukin-17 receptor C [Notolabrus celidotus]|uniref:interleukin-17 receptor C n=1 Tax=Notolabrus celidotus TaxID=1203425 RepID=UPI00148F8971|nr:interleukin-17 receptor C [Notolabrus celidotus]
MRLCNAVAVIAVVVFPLLLEYTTCQNKDLNDYVDGDCPVKLTSVPSLKSGGMYSEDVTVMVWAKAWDARKAQKIEIITPRNVICLGRKKLKNKKNSLDIKKHDDGVRCYRVVKQRFPQDSPRHSQWEQIYIVHADVRSFVSVAYSTTSMICTVNYTVSDPVPDFYVSVNQSSKSITVRVEPGHKVYARWCYLKYSGGCTAGEFRKITIDPSQSQLGLLNIPYLLPCVCVEVYYTHTDAQRVKKCPFHHERLEDVSDVWSSSRLTPFKNYLQWGSECPARDLQISASLCWKQHDCLCTPVLNLTLLETDTGNLRYNTSAVDKHPQMCVQLSLEGNYNLSCPFQSDKSSWEVYITAGKQSVYVCLTSTVQAEFSAQLCVLNEKGCTPVGPVHFAAVEAHTNEKSIHVPMHSLAEKPCVQVWQSKPALSGRRILCPDYTHNRWGMCAFAALIVVVVIVTLGIFIYRLTKRGAAGWLSIQKPVLLVCSSEQAAHVSAVCALASILQGDLSATVNMALWAQNSQTQAGAATGVADLGPLPWLYGQWEAVHKAQGKVLIVWSPEAKRTHEAWREERTTKRQERQLDGKRLEKNKGEKVVGEKVKQCDDIDCYSQKEPSTVIAPVFMATLACLEGALQQGKGQGVALVYFQGLGHSKDIPKIFRGVPRYCLPQDFRGFIQELGGTRRQTKTDKFKWHCWPRLLSKVLSIWLAQQLAQRLQTMLFQTQEKKMQGKSVSLLQKKKSDKTQSGLKLPSPVNNDRPGTIHEHEPLNVSPWRVETF